MKTAQLVIIASLYLLMGCEKFGIPSPTNDAQKSVRFAGYAVPSGLADAKASGLTDCEVTEKSMRCGTKHPAKIYGLKPREAFVMLDNGVRDRMGITSKARTDTRNATAESLQYPLVFLLFLDSEIYRNCASSAALHRSEFLCPDETSDTEKDFEKELQKNGWVTVEWKMPGLNFAHPDEEIVINVQGAMGIIIPVDTEMKRKALEKTIGLWTDDERSQYKAARLVRSMKK